MANSNYKKGRRKEYKIVHQLREQGFTIVQRSAGSRSPIDIWAVHRERRDILLIQVKPDNISKSAREKIEKEMDWLNSRNVLSKRDSKDSRDSTDARLGIYSVEFRLM